MMRYFKLVNDSWVECEYSDLKSGDRYYSLDAYGTRVETTFTEKVKNNKVVVTSHDKRAVTSVGEELSITAEFRDGDGNLISDFNDSFVMPVGRVGGSVEKSLQMSFVDGVCTRSVTFNQSGEYEVTKAMINLHLGNELDFDGFNISVYE